MRTDDETGEIENSVHLTLNDFDLETGETNSPYVGPNLNIFRKSSRRAKTFQVPKSCFEEKKRDGGKKRTYYVADKKEVINLKEVSWCFLL